MPFLVYSLNCTHRRTWVMVRHVTDRQTGRRDAMRNAACCRDGRIITEYVWLLCCTFCRKRVWREDVVNYASNADSRLAELYVFTCSTSQQFCLSVCPSNSCSDPVKMAKNIIKRFPPSDSAHRINNTLRNKEMLTESPTIQLQVG